MLLLQKTLDKIQLGPVRLEPVVQLDTPFAKKDQSKFESNYGNLSFVKTSFYYVDCSLFKLCLHLNIDASSRIILC